MREILFKAKRLNDGEWVEGNIVYVAEDADFMPGASNPGSWNENPMS